MHATRNNLVVEAVEGSDFRPHTLYGFVHHHGHALLGPLPEGRAVEVSFDMGSEITRSNAIVAPFVARCRPGLWPKETFGSWRLETVREIVLYVTGDTATHAGQHDAVRELIDGEHWLVIS